MKRDISFLLKLNLEEKKSLERLSKEAHLSMNSYIRVILFGKNNIHTLYNIKNHRNEQKNDLNIDKIKKDQQGDFMNNCIIELKEKLKNNLVLKPIPEIELLNIKKRRNDRLIIVNEELAKLVLNNS